VIDEGGRRLVAVSDLGQWLVARLQRDEAGRLRGVSDAEIHPILDRNGRPFAVKRAGDAEALEKFPDGSFLVAFEQVHRLARYAGPEPWRSRGEPQVAPREITRQPANGGIESMARLPDGRIVLISETDERSAGTLKAWIGSAGVWREATYRRRGDYRPVDAKALANGDLLVLERAFNLLGGFATRLVRVPAVAIRPGAILDGRDIAELGPPLISDNFEGLAVETAADGGTFVYLLSDDNRVALQRTLLLQFRLIP
jgi:hypothetical protein